MKLQDEREPLVGMSIPELERAMISLEEKPFRGRQIAEWMYLHGVSSFSEMTNLPLPLRARLEEGFTLGTLTERARRETPDRKTRKVAYALPDGGIIESVYMSTPRRYTFCLSSQHGCGFGCRWPRSPWRRPTAPLSRRRDLRDHWPRPVR
jgi:23S rRNA (adenine2503-C2)-methyltransferase